MGSIVCAIECIIRERAKLALIQRVLHGALLLCTVALKVTPRERSLVTILSPIAPHERSLATILSPITPRERPLATVLQIPEVPVEVHSSCN